MSPLAEAALMSTTSSRCRYRQRCRNRRPSSCSLPDLVASSLFVAGLSFEGRAGLLDDAKLAILFASFTAAIAGSAVILLNRNRRPALPEDPAPPRGGH